MSHHFESHTELLECISHYGWKEKIAFYSQISLQIQQNCLNISPKILEISWVYLLSQTNINVLMKTLNSLNIFTKTYSFQSLRVQRDMLHRLLELAKMRRTQIDGNISDIICTLILKEKDAMRHGQRQSFTFGFEAFSRQSQPTFLLGANEDDAMDEEETQTHIAEESFGQQNSYLLDLLLEELKGCRKEVLSLIATIASRLIKEDILSEKELKSLHSGIENVKNVIVSRRCVQSTEKAEIESTISGVLLELTSKY